MSSAPSPPLSGIRVLDLSRLLPGPFCTLILGDLGAQIDKLEDPFAGDYLRLFPPLKGGLSGRFAALNRNKRSLCLDLKRPQGREAFLRLLPRYDVLIESFRPGVLDRLGLSYEVLRGHHPRLVLCSISGYGQDGPYRDRAGHDLNYCALAGVLGLSGERGGAPHPLPVQLADVGGGALWAATGILAALFAAARTGEGRHVDVSMCEGALSFLIPDLGNLDAAEGAPPPGRGADLLTGGAACYGVYRTADGKFLSVAALEPKFWMAFCAAIGRRGDPAELVAPPAEQERLRAEVQGILFGKTRDEWVAHFAGPPAIDACVEPVLDLDEVARHPLHAARGNFFSVNGQEDGVSYGQVRTPLGPARAERPPPLPGQHTEEILGEAGLLPAEIAALRAAGVAR
jgi:crotonobetainyl-CoA:carnitine CoA-transferase CaiB-like acyl-CoA transferase